MCVIVTAQAHAMPTVRQLAAMSDANPDGAGIAWHDNTGLHRYRNPDNRQTLAFILANWNTLTANPFLLHFRLATHGSVCAQNTHPFRYQLADGETGYIAHNGVAHRYTHGRYASDSRNAILAWQTGTADLTDGSQGRYAKIDQTGTITWLYGAEATIAGETGTITVSNLNWAYDDIDMWETMQESWQEGYEEGYETALYDNDLDLTAAPVAPPHPMR